MPGATADTATGLGSPVGPSLIGDLVTSTITTPLPTSGVSVVANPPTKHVGKQHSHRAHVTQPRQGPRVEIREQKLARQEKRRRRSTRRPITRSGRDPIILC